MRYSCYEKGRFSPLAYDDDERHKRDKRNKREEKEQREYRERREEDRRQREREKQERDREQEQRRRHKKELERQKKADQQRKERQKQNEEEQERELYGKNDDGGAGSAVAKATVATAGAAAGVSALYRTGTISSAAKNIDRFSRFLKDANILRERHLQGDPTITNYRAFLRDAKQAWQSRTKEMDNGIRLSFRPGTMFEHIREMDAMRNASGIGGRAFRTGFLANDSRKYFNAVYSSQMDMDYNTLKKFNRFIDTISRHPSDTEHFMRTEQKFGFNPQEAAIAHDLEKRMKDLASSKDVSKNVRKKARDQAAAAADEGMSIDMLKRLYGKGDKDKETLIGRVNRTVKDLIHGKDRAATMRDVFNNEDEILNSWNYKNKNRKMEAQRTIDRLKELREEFKAKGQEDDFLDLTPDSFGLRVDTNGKLYSFSSSHEIYDTVLGAAASTLPGKILKLRDFQYLGKMPAAHYFAKGEKDPILAARIRKSGVIEDDSLLAEGRLDTDYYQIGDRIFRGLEDGSIEDTGIEGMHMISGRYGAQYRELRAMLGDTRYKKSDNKYLSWLDIGQDYEEWNGSIFNDFRGIFKKHQDPTWRGNVFARIFDNSDEARQAVDNFTPDQAMGYLNDVDTFMDFMKEHTFKLDQETIQKLMDHMDDDSLAKKYLGILQETDLDKLEHEIFLQKGNSLSQAGTFLNKDLNRLMNLRAVDPGDAKNVLDLQEKPGTPTSEILSAFSNNTVNKGADYEEQLRREFGKEALMQYAAEKGGDASSDYKAVFDLIKTSNLRNQNDVNARRLASIAYLQNAAGSPMKNRITRDENGLITNVDVSLHTEIDNIFTAFSGTTDESAAFRETSENLINEHVSSLESYFHNDDIETPEAYSDIIHINDTVGVVDMLKSMNDWTKLKATTKSFFSQWNAGRDNPEDITTATLVPYFFLKRLSDDMNSVGLGFSRDSVGSTGQFIKNIMLKRVIPVGLAVNYFEWLDDTSQEITGTSITGAAANGIADVDLGIRKVLDFTGMRDWLNEEKSINPIMQYWGDHTDFMSYDQRKKYYESGYDPVRKGAWWTFGGVNEARGSEIEYWEPSFVRRINSDYEDKALYDGYFDKWSHSLLPTPSNPLSPLFAILDPYWMEKKHEDDRPYPVSGPMFQEGTPWGAILNATIGNLIKPETELHPWRLRNGVDIESALHRMNEWIKDKARDIGRQNYIVLNGSSMQPVTFTAYDAPTEDTKVYSVQSGPGDGEARAEEGVYGVAQSSYEPSAGLGDANGSGMVSEGGAPTPGGIASVVTGTKDITAEDLLKDPDQPIDYKAALKQKLFGVGDGYIQDGKLVTDKDGKLKEVVYKPDGEVPNPELGEIKLSDSLSLDSIINGDNNGIKHTLKQIVDSFHPIGQIKQMNDATKKAAAYNAAYDESEGFMTPDKLSQYRPSEGMSLLDDADTVAELVNAGQGYDLVHDAAVSWRLIAGIYGYMGGATLGVGDQTEKHIARSNDMTSFARTFWDSNMGGAGGDVMEIVRRFIPDFKRSTRVNPLMNEMPDWLPERYRYGDPYTEIIKGEMRLPGKGYEALNDLHPDQFGKYTCRIKNVRIAENSLELQLPIMCSNAA